jgi:hypothetical protein
MIGYFNTSHTAAGSFGMGSTDARVQLLLEKGKDDGF